MTTWADQFNTYQDAALCRFKAAKRRATSRCLRNPRHGPREFAIEAAYKCIEVQDEMEARGGPLPALFWDWEG